MIVPSNYSNILQNGTREINGVIYPNLLIKVVPGPLSNSITIKL